MQLRGENVTGGRGVQRQACRGRGKTAAGAKVQRSRHQALVVGGGKQVRTGYSPQRDRSRFNMHLTNALRGRFYFCMNEKEQL